MELFRVDTTAESPESVTLAFVGHMQRQHLAEVARAIADAKSKSASVIIDLHSLRLLDSDSAHFLCHCKSAGLPIVNSPAFIKRWVSLCVSKQS